MRILHVVPTYFPATRYGGPIYSVHGLCKSLTNRGHDVHVFTTNVDGNGDTDLPLGVPVNLDGINVWYFASQIMRRLYWSPSMLQRLRFSIKDFDVVHLHSLFLWPINAAAQLADKSSIPYVLSPRGMLVKDLVQRRSPVLKSVWISLFERRNLERAASVHVTTEREKRDCDVFNFDIKNYCVVPNGIDLHSPKQNASTLPLIEEVIKHPQLLLYLGRINWKKGLDRLMYALAYVPDAFLAIAGNDEEEYTPKLKVIADKAGVSDRIQFLGAVNSSDKLTLLRRSRLLVLPSYSENFGNVVLEAMQQGCPVVVTPEVGLAETVAKTESGIVCSGTPEELSKALLRILKDSQLAERFSKNGIKTARTQFSWEEVGRQMEGVYKGVISKCIASA